MQLNGNFLFCLTTRAPEFHIVGGSFLWPTIHTNSVLVLEIYASGEGEKDGEKERASIDPEGFLLCRIVIAEGSFSTSASSAAAATRLPPLVLMTMKRIPSRCSEQLYCCHWHTHTQSVFIRSIT